MAERHQRMLKKLAEMAMRLAEASEEEAMAEIVARKAEPAKPEPVRDPMLAFSRMARVVRQTVALESKLEKERKTEAGHNAWADYYCRYAMATFASNEQKRRVRRVVKREIERSTPWDSEREILTEHLSERLDDEGECVISPTTARPARSSPPCARNSASTRTGTSSDPRSRRSRRRSRRAFKACSTPIDGARVVRRREAATLPFGSATKPAR